MNARPKARLRILLFEDNRLLRSMLHRMFLEQGWEVLVYPDPAHCPLRHAARCACDSPQVCADVIVTDLEMPDVDGLTFVRDLLGAGCRVRFLAMFTAADDPAELAKAKDLGFAVFSKVDGLTALLKWLHEIERLINGGRALIPCAKLTRR